MSKALRPEDVAARWECSEATVRRMLRDGRLRGFRVGGKLWRIRPEVVEEFECQNETDGGSSSFGESGAPTGETRDVLSAARWARQTVR